jgi:hypothetical protein
MAGQHLPFCPHAVRYAQLHVRQSGINSIAAIYQLPVLKAKRLGATGHDLEHTQCAAMPCAWTHCIAAEPAFFSGE